MRSFQFLEKGALFIKVSLIQKIYLFIAFQLALLLIGSFASLSISVLIGRSIFYAITLSEIHDTYSFCVGYSLLVLIFYTHSNFYNFTNNLTKTLTIVQLSHLLLTPRLLTHAYYQALLGSLFL